eukprot:gene17351-biopygen17549
MGRGQSRVAPATGVPWELVSPSPQADWEEAEATSGPVSPVVAVCPSCACFASPADFRAPARWSCFHCFAYFSRVLITGTQPQAFARCSAVLPDLLLIVGSAFCSHRYCTTVVCPFHAARINGVSPCTFGRLTSTPDSVRNRTMGRCPLIAASDSVVFSLLYWDEMSAPAPWRRRRIAKCPCSAAHTAAVLPFFDTQFTSVPASSRNSTTSRYPFCEAQIIGVSP